jgi:NAD(P) transhydrogenase
MGAEFLEVNIEEDGSTVGGYAKEMSKEFIEAEMQLFHDQCKDIDILISTALIPGKTAPILIKKYMVDDMKPGSVIVDLAAEAGGNIETTRPGEIYVYNDVTHIGLTDLPSRLPTQSSTLYANNLSKLMLSMTGTKDHYHLDFNDDVVRGSIVLNKGVMSWPPNPPIAVAAAAAPAGAAAAKAEVIKVEPNYFNIQLKDSLKYTIGLGGLNVLGMSSPNANFTAMTTIFGLSVICGYHTVWSVVPALHSPLMSVTNAISGITAVGGLMLMGGGYYPTNCVQGLAASAAFISFINVFGGFIVTARYVVSPKNGFSFLQK